MIEAGAETKYTHGSVLLYLPLLTMRRWAQHSPLCVGPSISAKPGLHLCIEQNSLDQGYQYSNDKLTVKPSYVTMLSYHADEPQQCT
jgi:hypothetical protein